MTIALLAALVAVSSTAALAVTPFLEGTGALDRLRR